MCVFGKVGEGNGGFDGRKVYLIDLIIGQAGEVVVVVLAFCRDVEKSEE